MSAKYVGPGGAYKMTKYIEMACGDCILRIEAWRPSQGDLGVVDVQVISNSSSRWNMLFKNRIRNAWKVLRGTYDGLGYELYTLAELEALISALQVASKEAFPDIISETEVKRP